MRRRLVNRHNHFANVGRLLVEALEHRTLLAGQQHGIAMSVTANATSGPVITQNPTSLVIREKDEATFSAAASGNPTPTVTWSLVSGYIGGGNGVTSNTLDVGPATPDESSNQYQATFTNSAGSVTTSAATLEVVAAHDDTYHTPLNTTLLIAAPGVMGNDSGLLGNFSGLNEIPVLISSPDHGTVQLRGDGQLMYTPASGYSGSDSFQYAEADLTTPAVAGAMIPDKTSIENQVIPDGATTVYGYDFVLSDPATVTIGDAFIPHANSDVYGYNEEGNITENDYAINPVPVIRTSPSNGTLYVLGDGTMSYTPNAGFSGKDSFTYEIADFNDQSLAAQYYFKQSPTAAQLSSYSPGDYTLSNSATVTLSENSNAPTLTTSSPPPQAVPVGADVSFTETATGTPTPTVQWYEHSAGDASTSLIPIAGATSTTLDLGPATAQESGNVYQAIFSNSFGQAESEETFLDVVSAGDDSFNTTENASLAVTSTGVLQNDTGFYNEVNLVSNPAHGTLALDGDGDFTYTPAAGFTGLDSFTYYDLDVVFDSGNLYTVHGKPRNQPVSIVKNSVDQVSGIAGNVATVTIMVGTPPSIVSSQIGTGSAQRSSIKTFSVTFNEPVALGAGAYTLQQEPLNSNGSINTSGTAKDVTAGVAESTSGNTATFTVLAGGSLDRTASSGKAGLLTNGIYQLVLHGSQIISNNLYLNGGADQAVPFASSEASGGSSPFFHALFGDDNGDGVVNLADYRLFARSYPSTSGGAKYDVAFDYGGDGVINLLDYRQFAVDYLKQVVH